MATSPIITEINKTNKNVENKKTLLTATVLANYGDPGLEEDYFADILSRYIICMIDSPNRVLTNDRWASMIVAVKRPEHLWISYDGGFSRENLQQQRRIDANLNGNVGPAAAYSTDTIPKINYPYRLGEKISIKPIEEQAQNILRTSCPLETYDDESKNYGVWHSQAENLIDYDDATKSSVRLKTIFPPTSQEYPYSIIFTKGHYEAMSLFVNGNGPKSLFNNSIPENSPFYTVNGGYLFYQYSYAILNSIKYEDTNIGGKYRISSNSCMPLIVASPNSFAAPQVRTIGTINYSPTYIPRES